ncbi:MAG: PSD1 and planctomycete cytochrome C domain-containing protein [Planctomycetaceae bacterium]
MRAATLLLFLIAAVHLHGAPVANAWQVTFNRDVRPILSDACFQCHGPDEQQRKGGLRLDQSEGALKGGDSGPAIVPGRPGDSLLWQRILSADPDIHMPPPETGRTLTPEQQETLRQWIEQGASWEGHWAFQPIRRPPLPAGSFGAAHPIDTMIRRRLQESGLRPAPEASRETIIRRVTLDLTGLPPTLEEVDAFLSDNSEQAYERLVDRLLSSPRYGERMAQQWLDFARYADSNGFQVDSSRQMWAWRDWVINAFNRNHPFDQFTIDQLAGDMLPAPTQDQIIATGFNRNTRLNGEGGRIAEEWFAETVIDRVETAGLTWMGLTLNCCRCHDHKYDPISQREFYQLFAFFNSNEESGVLDSEGGTPGRGNSRPVHTVITPEHQRKLEELARETQLLDTRLQELQQTAAERQPAWEAETLRKLASEEPTWRQLELSKVASTGNAVLERQSDGSWLATGPNPAHDEYRLESPLAAGAFSGVLLECLPDSRLPNSSLGRYSNGNFVLSGILAEITAPALSKPIPVQFVRAVADYEQNGWPVSKVLDGQARNRRNQAGWAVDGPTRREICRAVFALVAPIEIPADARLHVTLRHDAINGHNIGRFKLFSSALPPATLSPSGASFPEAVRVALQMPTAARSPEQQQRVTKYFLENGDTAAAAARARLDAARKAVEDEKSQLPIVMVMKEMERPREARILIRGQYDRPGEIVERGVPTAIAPFPADFPRNRLGFARWLVSPDHPLTARVWANRTWERFFGTGIVKTTENLGSQSDWPSHPELLDWLAAELMQPTFVSTVSGQSSHAWDIKALDKLIVLSAAYRQSAKAATGDYQADPENRLISRGPRFRLSAETLRDQALAMSGLLVPDIGGPSVRPYMPEGVWDETSRYGDLRGYRPDAGSGLYRRSLYTIWKRTAAPPSMLLFDAPSREICTVKRSRTNTPLQALALLNETTWVEAARKLAERCLTNGIDSDTARLEWAFRTVTARRPEPQELELLLRGLQEDLARFRADPAAARQLISVGRASPAADIPPETLAAWTLTTTLLLNLDEVLVH